jgi:hypothetical protein
MYMGERYFFTGIETIPDLCGCHRIAGSDFGNMKWHLTALLAFRRMQIGCGEAGKGTNESPCMKRKVGFVNNNKLCHDDNTQKYK